MSDDAARWDEKYRGRLGDAAREPDRFVLAALGGLGAGAGRDALDVACGTGRHALALAEAGWAVTACDVSAVATARLAERARDRGARIRTVVADLTDPSALRGRSFDLVVIVDFLDRAFLQRLDALVARGGHALVSTFTVDWPGAHPSARFRLERGELATALPRFEAVETEERDGRAALLARRL